MTADSLLYLRLLSFTTILKPVHSLPERSMLPGVFLNIGSPANQFIYLAENDFDLGIRKQWRGLKSSLRELQISPPALSALVLSLTETAPFTAQGSSVTGKSQICGRL